MLTRRQLLVAGAVVLVDGAATPARGSVLDRRLLVSVLTCPRPGGASYLEETLQAVDAELAAADRILVCDGYSPRAVPRGWTTLTLKARPPRPPHGYQDNRTPGWGAIWTAFAMDADLLFLEDDVRPLSSGSFSTMAAHRVADGAAFTSFYHRARAPGTYDAGGFDMSQAVLIPFATVRALWEAKGRLSRFVPFVDLAIAEIGRHAGWKFEQTRSLVQHVGRFSAAMPGYEW